MPVVPPLGPKEIVDASIATIKLGTAIVGLAEQAKKDKRTLLAGEVIGEMLKVTGRNARAHLQELRRIKIRLTRADVDMSKTADAIWQDARWWRRRQYLAIRDFRHNSLAQRDGLMDAFQDLVSLAHCKEAEDLIPRSHVEADEAVEARLKVLEDDLPLGKLLQALIREAEALNARIAEVSGRRSGGAAPATA